MSQAIKNLVNTLQSIPLIEVLTEDDATQTVGVSLSYLGSLYTVYFDAVTLQGDLLKHDDIDITQIENVGAISVEALVQFVTGLPQLKDIAR